MTEEKIRIFDATWHKGSIEKPLRTYKEPIGSEDVLIDLTGKREIFRVGYYSYTAKKWIIYDQNHGYKLRYLYWQCLPLAKYDNI